MNIAKAAAPALLALLAAGCVDLVEKEDLDALTARFDKFSVQMAQKNDVQALYADQVVKQVTALEKKVGEMDLVLNDLKARVARLEDLQRTMQGQIDALGKAPAPSATPGQPAAEAPKSTMKIEEILLEIETVLTQLRGGKLKTEEAATRLKPFAQHAAPRLITEMQSSITQFEYTKQLEAILGKFPPAELKVPLQDALRRPAVRESAARIVGATGDRDLSKILEDHLGETDEDFRLNIGDALVRCRNGSGIPLLLQSLKSDQGTTRTIAISALKKINRGEDLGYRPQLAPEANAAAIKAWDEWSDKFAKTLFE